MSPNLPPDRTPFSRKCIFYQTFDRPWCTIVSIDFVSDSLQNYTTTSNKYVSNFILVVEKKQFALKYKGQILVLSALVENFLACSHPILSYIPKLQNSNMLTIVQNLSKRNFSHSITTNFTYFVR